MSERPSSRRLLLLPGLGANARLFDPQQPIAAEIEVPPWIEPALEESLADYGRRMAANVRVNPSFYLGGVSFGGMLALEMAKHLKPAAIILIASCRSPLSINQALLNLAPLARRMPRWLLRFGAASSPRFIRRLMARSPELVRWGPGAIARWPGVVVSDVPVFQIHGGCDRIIPARQVQADALVRTGGHLINLTHANAVNQFIEGVFRRVEGSVS